MPRLKRVMEIDIATLRGWIGRKEIRSERLCDATGARFTQASVTLQAPQG